MNAEPVRLHLGCGEVYLPGYVNVDFPPEQHSVQTETRADVWADLTTLEYPSESVTEIRLHHVFEHFTRPTALGLLIRWYDWLVDEGELVIETPDFERMVREFQRAKQPVEQGVALRHIFGSHEAAWAVHCDGWYPGKFEHVLPALGYGDLEVTRSEWRGTHNVAVLARKRSPFLDKRDQLGAAENLFREVLVDDTTSEQRLLETWLGELRSRAS